MSISIADHLAALNGSISNRNAYSSIDGYFYQFELTLLHILIDQTPDDPFKDAFGVTSHFKIEHVEDYSKYFSNGGIEYARLAQIKHHNKYAGNSEYLEALLWLYYSFLELENSASHLKTMFYVFHHDKSPVKNVSIVLKEAFEKNENEPDINKQYPVYRRIIALGSDSPTMRSKFITQANFIKTPSLTDVTQSNKQKLYTLFGSEQYNPDFLYAAALSKIITEGRSGAILSFEEIENYFRSNPIIKPEYYEWKIKQLIGRALDEYLFQMSEPNPLFPGIKIADDIILAYESVAAKILDFFERHFKDPQKRTVFISFICDSTNVNPMTNLNIEYEEFSKNFIHIRAFIFKLAKIVYAYEKNTGLICDLDKWFEFTDTCWLFKHPHEQRKQGVILADPQQSMNALKTIGMLRTRLSTIENEEQIPNVWYWGNIGELRASHMIPYKLNITKVPVEEWSLNTCEPDSYFTVQCLNCLNVSEAGLIDHVPNIFKVNCMMR